MAKQITFKYNGRIYKAQHLKNKLKALGCTEQDIEIIPEVEKHIEYADPNRLYYFINPKTGCSITSIYPTISDPDYEPTTLEYLKSKWNNYE